MDQLKTKILVVDDDRFVAEMFTMILEASGYEVETAGNGREALRMQNESPFDLILSDMNMPEMDGLELITSIRERGLEIPIVILTGNNEISVAIQALNAGASDYLLKDENIQETIPIAAEKALEKHHLKVKNRELLHNLSLRNSEMEKERAIACKVQEAILPQRLDFPGFQTGTFYRASNLIGGDFFDAWETGGHIHFIIGDISGHSTSSALMMAVCKGMFNSLGQAMNDPREIVKVANRMLCRMLTESGMFVSLVYACFERASEELRIVSAGHNPVYLLAGEERIEIQSTGAVLGWDEDDSWEIITCRFAPGSRLFLYTDGLVEAKNASGEEFEETLLTELHKPWESPALMVERLVQQVGHFCSHRFEDDITIFAVGRE